MRKYKIAVYAIAKNEEKFAKRWAESMAEADYRIVCDTGSTDQTIKILKEEGVTVDSITVTPWRFDTPRNICIDMIPEDVDICVCTDLDEVFDPGWRQILEDTWQPHTQQCRYTFVWRLDDEGNPLKTSSAQKIHARHGFKWIYPVHEVLEYTGTAPHIFSDNYNLRITHLQDHTKSRRQYLPLLELSAKDFPKYDRNIHYLGREYMYYGKYKECIETLQYHLTLENALWSDERCASMRYIASSYESLGDIFEAKRWLYRAIAEAPHTREPLLAMAKLAYNQQDWPLLYSICKSAFKISQPTGSYLDEPECWGFFFPDYAAISAYQLGIGDEAIAFAKLALSHAPDDERLKNNLDFCIQKFNN